MLKLLFILAFLTTTAYGQSPNAVLSQLGVKGVTGTGGTTNYADYLVKLDAQGKLPATVAPGADLRVPHSPYVIDPVYGVDSTSNNGSFSSPYKTITYAITNGATNDPVFILASGAEHPAVTLDTGAYAGLTNASFYGLDAKPVRVSEIAYYAAAGPRAPTLTLGSVYVGTLGQYNNRVLDLRLYDRAGVGLLRTSYTNVNLSCDPETAIAAYDVIGTVNTTSTHTAQSIGYTPAQPSLWNAVISSVGAALEELVGRANPTGAAAGDLSYWNGTNWIRLAAGATNQTLVGGTAPAFDGYLYAQAQTTDAHAVRIDGLEGHTNVWNGASNAVTLVDPVYAGAITGGVGVGATVAASNRLLYVSTTVPTGTAASVQMDLDDHKTNAAAHSELFGALAYATVTNTEYGVTNFGTDLYPLFGLTESVTNDIAKGVTAYGWGNFADAGLLATNGDGSALTGISATQVGAIATNGLTAAQVAAAGGLTNIAINGTTGTVSSGIANITVSMLNSNYFTMTPMSTNGWSWYNQTNATIEVNNSVVVLAKRAMNGNNLSFFVTNCPPTPYSLVACISLSPAYNGSANYLNMGLGWITTNDSKSVCALMWSNVQGMNLAKFNNFTTYSASYATTQLIPCGQFWVRLRDDGTNRTVSVSDNPLYWRQLHSVSRTDFTTPTHIGLFGDYNSLLSDYVTMSVYSLSFQ